MKNHFSYSFWLRWLLLAFIFAPQALRAQSGSGATNCLVVDCAADKAVQCGTPWSFDQPTATSCCTNPFAGGGAATNVLITPLGFSTNGACPQLEITEYWSIADACGNRAVCKQTVTIFGCCTNCLEVECPPDRRVQCGTAWTFDQPIARSCCTNQFISPAGLPTNVMVIPAGFVTNGACPLLEITENWVIQDACGNMTNCSQTVTVVGCCTNKPCLQVICSADKPVQCGTPWKFDPPTVYSCCTNEFFSSAATPTNALITSAGFVTNGTCPHVEITETWSIADACGDTTNCSQTVTVLGCCTNNPPCLVVDCSSNKTVQCGSQWTFDPPKAFSCCTNEFISATGLGTNVMVTPASIVTNGSCPQQEITITWDIFDACGDATNCSQTVTVLGCCTNYPCLQVDCSSNKYVQCGTVWSFDPPLAYSCCTNRIAGATTNVIVVSTGFVTNGACPALEITENWMISDACGDTANCSQTVTVVGCCTNQPCLTVDCPVNKTVQCGTTWSFDEPTATSCCTNVFSTTSPPTKVVVVLSGIVTNGVCPKVEVTATWDIFDACGDATNCSQTVTIIGCCGNTNCLVVDCPPAKHVQCGTPWSFDQPTATSCCTNPFAAGGVATNVLITPLGFSTNGACPQLEITKYWSIADACGNKAVCSQTVTVFGCCTNPCLEVECPPDKRVQCGTAWTFDQPAVYSCCTNQFISPAGLPTNVMVIPAGFVTNGACPLLEITENWVIQDACGNTTNCSQTVTVVGCCTSKPCLQVICSADKTVQCGTPWTFDPPTVYSCCTNEFFSSSGAVAPTNVLITPAGFVTNGTCPRVDITETWSIADACGNVTNCSQTVTVLGCCTNNPPCLVVDCPTNKTVQCGTQWTFDQPKVFTCCTNEFVSTAGLVTNVMITPSSIVTNGSCPQQEITITWNIFDACGDSTNCSQTVTVLGCCTNRPCLEVDCASNKYVQCGTVWSFDTPLVYTCCTNRIPGTPTNVSVISTGFVTNGACPALEITETWSIFDGCNDSTTCSQTVTVVGCCTNQPCLTVNCPTNKTVQCGTTWSFDEPTAKSCCTNGYSSTTGLPTNTLIVLSGIVTNGVCPKVEVTATWDIFDVCGDSATCSQTVTILGCCGGTNCLIVDCAANKTVECGSVWAFDPPVVTTCCASDIPGTKTNLLVSAVTTITNGVCPKVVTRTWFYIDGCGDSNTCSQTVTVIDTTPPVVTCPTNIIVVNLNSNCLLVIPPVSITATDNCTPVCSLIYSQSPPAGTIVPGPSAAVTVCVSDLCGNTNCCTVLVEGQDKTPPIVIVPQYVIATNCVVPCVPIVARSLCCPAIPTVTQQPPCGSPLGAGVNTITIIVTDCHGNSVTRLVHVVVGGSGSFLSALTNTGIGLTGLLLPDDSVDPHYSLPAIAVPAGVPGDYHADAVAVSDICHITGNGCAYLNDRAAAPCYEYVPWSLPPDAAYNPTAVSKWIGPNYTNNGCDPAGNYTYTLNFNLPAGLNPSTATISGRWASDNAASLKLNGNPIPLATPSFASWTPFTIPVGSPFVAGANSLQFTVTNFGSFTGLRVEFTNAFSTCFDCVPPVISSITPSQSLPAGSTATFNVVAGGTPPLSYQWQFNYGNIAGATTSTLAIPSITYSNAGLYTVIVSDPCGSVTDYVRLGVTRPLPWQWANWNVATVTDPLAASFGQPLGLTGSNAAPNYSITAGTADDFGIDNPNGGSPNVIEINPRSGVGLELPMVTPSGTTADASYTLILDLYEPDTSLGTPSTIFISSSNVNLITSGDQDGLSVSLDASNYVHVTAIFDGNLYDLVSSAPFPVDTWNRLGIVVQGPQPDGTGASIDAYLNGVITTTVVICPCCVIHITPIDWSVSPPVLFPGQLGADQNAEFFVSDIQFHSIAMTAQMIAGLGSPDAGPAPVNQTTVSQQPPPLTATMSGGLLNITWPDSPYELQETTDLSSGIWTTSTLPFTETQAGGNVTTTAGGTSPSQGPAKFYRLVFRP